MAGREPFRRAPLRTALVLAVAGGLLAGMPLPRSGAVPEAVVRGVTLPLTEMDVASRGLRVEGGALRALTKTRTGAVTTCAPIWFDGLALTWSQPVGRPPTAIVATGADRRAFGKPVRVDAEGGPDPGGEEYVDGPRGSSFLWTGGARCARISLAMPAGTALAGLRVLFINSSGTAAGPGTGPPPSGPVTTGAPSSLPSASALTRQPGIITREQWGADPKLMNCTPEVAPFLAMGFVHHTAGSNAYSREQSDDIVRGIYAYHTRGRGWCDIGYNFLVDRFGNVFEGRSGGVTENVIGAAQMGFNTGAFSVSVMGTFDTSSPPRAAVRALERLLAWRLDLAHVNPLGWAEMTSAGGSTTRFERGTVVRLHTISGHRDTGLTACPGSSLYRLLSGVRQAVGGLGLPKIYAPRLSVTTLVAGERHRIRVAAKGSRSLHWSVTVLGPSGEEVARLPEQRGDRLALDWRPLLEVQGDYRVIVAAADAKGHPARPAELTFTVEAPPPSPTPSVSASPTPSASPSVSPSATPSASPT